MGFGCHAALSYQELKQNQADYADWVVRTARESEGGKTCDPRLYRLGSWLMRPNEENHPVKTQVATPVQPISESELLEKGYLKTQGLIGKASTAPSRTSSRSESSSQAFLAQANAALAQLTQSVLELREEVSDLKQELPRKGTKTEDDASMDDKFSLVSATK